MNLILLTLVVALAVVIVAFVRRLDGLGTFGLARSEAGMAQVNCPPSVQACYLRIVRRDATGAKVTGATAGYVTDAMARIKISPVKEDGAEFKVKNACGTFIINSKARDVVIRYALELDLLVPDPEIDELLVGSSLLISAANNIGTQAPALGVLPADNGVSIEFWTRAAAAGGGQVAAGGAWYHWAIPWTYWGEGDREFADSALTIPYTGYAIENPNFSTGPAAPLFVSAITRAYARQRESAIPTVACGYTTIA